MARRPDELLFLPLGGAGEIGMNLNLYGFGPEGHETWLMVDLGVTFGDPSSPAVDVIMPDAGFIEERRERLAGIVLTHGHEDHIGAVPYLWERLGAPIYATPFTASLVRGKLREAGLENKAELIIVPMSGTFEVGPFHLELVTLTHSIPEPNALVIRTPLGTVLHTGDWKLDPDPVIGPTSDLERLKHIGEEGVLAIVCDSTNALNEGSSGSEADILGPLTELIGKATGKVAVACFASNVARLETISKAAAANGRDVVSAGRSIKRIEAAARENGYLADTPAFIDDLDAGYLPADKQLIICTGSQGESRAALSRIAENTHPYVTLGEGDTVIFSSRVIPGNELAIGRLQNQLIGRGVELITWEDGMIHVSGHPAQDELIEMYNTVRPHISVPVHGELRHLVAHARLARSCQVSDAFVIENGAVLKLAPGRPGVVDQAPSGRLALEGGRLVPLDGELVRGRKRAMYNGTAMVTLVVEPGGKLYGAPQFSSNGLTEGHDPELQKDIARAVRKALKELKPREFDDDDSLREAVRLAVRRTCYDIFDKKPVTQVHLVRL